MATKQTGWFLIMVSWEPGADGVAQESFKDVLNYLRIFDQTTENKEGWQKEKERIKNENPNDARFSIDSDSLKAFNLIGRRKFVIIFRIESNSHMVLLELSKIISWSRPMPINVEIFPASYVFEVESIFPNFSVIPPGTK